MVKVRIDGIGENDAYIEVEATKYGLELGVGYGTASAVRS